MHRERIAICAQLFARDAPHARGRDLCLRDPYDILIGHTHRKMARDLLHQLALCAEQLVSFDNWSKATEVQPCIADTLVMDQTPDAFESDCLRDGWKRARNFMFDHCRRWRGAPL